MKDLRKGRIFLMITAFVTVFVVSMAMLWNQQILYNADLETFEVVKTLKGEDIDLLNSCYVDEDGTVKGFDIDPYIVFGGLNDNLRVIKINFAEPISEDTEIELFIDDGSGFSQGLKAKHVCKEGDTHAFIVLLDFMYCALRLDVNIDYKFESIELGTAEMIGTKLANNDYWPLQATAYGILAAIAIFFIDKKKNLVDKIKTVFSWFKKNFLKGFVSLMIVGAISVFISLVWRGRPAFDLFEIYNFLLTTAFVFFLLTGIACVWFHRKTFVEDIEKIFVVLLLCSGITMILITPLACASWDTETHYRLSLETSYLGNVACTQGDMLVINYGEAAAIKGDPYSNYSNAAILTNKHGEIVNAYASGTSWSHFPSAVFIALARFIGMPFIALFMFGKLGNLLSYTLLCYLAMRKLKSGKMVLAVIALFPTSIFLASNYSYDWWVTGFSILGVAYFVGALQNKEEKISTIDVCIMCAALAIACIPKTIYFPLMLLPFLMPPEKFKNKKIYYVICVLAFAILLSKFINVSGGMVASTGDIRGGETVGPADQVAYIFSDIFGYAFMLLRFLFTDYLSVSNMTNYISNYAYFGVATGSAIIMVLMLLNVLFDRDEAYQCKGVCNWLSRIYVVLMYIGGSALVATSMYVAFTPVGSEFIAGCQPRYIIPWLYPMLSLWSMNRIKPIIPKKLLYVITMLGCYGVLYYQMYTVFLPRVVVM